MRKKSSVLPIQFIFTFSKLYCHITRTNFELSIPKVNYCLRSLMIFIVFRGRVLYVPIYKKIRIIAAGRSGKIVISASWIISQSLFLCNFDPRICKNGGPIKGNHFWHFGFANLGTTHYSSGNVLVVIYAKPNTEYNL